MSNQATGKAPSGVPYPPESMRAFVGAGDFVGIGNAWRDYFVDVAGLRPNQRVLDLGCGIGRIAIPLTGVIGSDGSYEGLDINGRAIDWCRENISSLYPNFRFTHLDVSNKCYNPGGSLKASEFRLPLSDAQFDLVILTSVFTHMLTDDMENYVREITRVLKPGGKCAITYYLLNAASRGQIASGASGMRFTHAVDEVCATSTPDDPERFIAFDEDHVRRVYQRNGLVTEDVRYGSWSGLQAAPRYQDVILASRA